MSFFSTSFWSLSHCQNAWSMMSMVSRAHMSNALLNWGVDTMFTAAMLVANAAPGANPTPVSAMTTPAAPKACANNCTTFAVVLLTRTLVIHCQAMSTLMPWKLKIPQIALTIIGATTVVETLPVKDSGTALVRTACLYSRRDSFIASWTFSSTRTPCAWENMALTWSLFRLLYVTPTRFLMDFASSVLLSAQMF